MKWRINLVSSRNILRRQKTLRRVCPEKEAVQLQTTQGVPIMYSAQTKDFNPAEKSAMLCEPPYIEWYVWYLR